MTEQQKVEKDGSKLENIMKGYSGAGGGHFGLIVTANGKRHYCTGGRVDLVGICMSEALANMVRVTPQLDETYIDMIAESAKELLKEARKVQ